MVRPGVETTVTNQYVARFHTAKTSRTPISSGVMALISAHTSEKSATLLLTYQITATNSTIDSPYCQTCPRRFRRVLSTTWPPSRSDPEPNVKHTGGHVPSREERPRMFAAGQSTFDMRH